MLAIYQTPTDYLYLVLTISIGLVALMLVIALVHLVRILSNINTITAKTKDTVDLVNHYLWQPIKIMMSVIEKGKEMAQKKKCCDK